jgi:hypothetical protein
MPLIHLIVVIAVVAVLIWLLFYYLPIPQPVRVILAVALGLILLIVIVMMLPVQPHLGPSSPAAGADHAAPDQPVEIEYQRLLAMGHRERDQVRPGRVPAAIAHAAPCDPVVVADQVGDSGDGGHAGSQEPLSTVWQRPGLAERLVGVRGFEPPAPASRTQCLGDKPLINCEPGPTISGVSPTYSCPVPVILVHVNR